jgi:membrane protein involved in colicin uptake
LGGYTSKEQADRAERDRKEKAERAKNDRVKTARKAQEKAEKTERDRAKTARKAQEKADRTEKDRAEKARKVQDRADKDEKARVESAKQSERARLFDEVLSRASTHSKGCCEPCNSHVIDNNGEYQPCKLGHEDSGPDKETCVDCTESRYHPKK